MNLFSTVLFTSTIRKEAPRGGGGYDASSFISAWWVNRLILLCCLLSVMFGSTAIVKSQAFNPPCNPTSPCSTGGWQSDNLNVSIGDLASTCSATVRFDYRLCNGIVEMIVTEITFTGSGCTDLTSAEIFDRALYLTLLAKMPSILAPVSPTSFRNWKIARPGCVKKNPIPQSNGSISLESCMNVCCFTNATIEPNSNCNQVIFGWEYPYSFQPLCPLEEGANGCHENCSVNIEHAFDRSRYPH